MFQKILNFKYLPLAIIGVIVFAFMLLKVSSPEAKRRPPPAVNTINIEVETLGMQNIPIQLHAYGIVKPRTQSTLIAEVSGRVIVLSDKFRDGAFFKKDDVLLELDDADYLADIALAKADLATAEKDYQQELAQVEQAKEDWKRLNGNDKAPSLVLREPQRKAAQSRVDSSKAKLTKAQLNYQRTKIKAPFDGRVLNKNIDLGQVVSANSKIGEIYATDAIEITLPIKNTELALINLPETYRTVSSSEQQPAVQIQSSLYPQEFWNGKIIRTSSSISDSTRQISVTALINDPYGPIALNRPPLKIGEYVTAKIQGKVLENAITIPNRAIYQGSYVYLFRDNGVYRTNIKIYWQDEQQAIIESGLKSGDVLVLTPLGQVSSGTPAKVINNVPSIIHDSNKKNDATDIADWIAQLPSDRLKRLKSRAKKENKTLEEIAALARKNGSLNQHKDQK